MSFGPAFRRGLEVAMMRLCGCLLVVLIATALMVTEAFTSLPSPALFCGAGVIWVIAAIGLGEALDKRPEPTPLWTEPRESGLREYVDVGWDWPA